MRVSRGFLFAYNYVYPFLGFPLLLWLWHRKTGTAFTAFVMGVPLVFGYLIPGIGTNILKKWRFHGRMLLGNYFAHHGIIYSSTMGLALFISFPSGQPSDGILESAWIVVRTAALVGFVGWWHDILGVKAGMVEVFNGPWRRGAGPEEIVTSYAPICFPALGAAYAGTAMFGYPFLVEGGHNSALAWLIPTGVAAMSLAGSIPYLFMEDR